MTCPACTKAMTNPRSEEWGANCQSCEARALVLMGAHLESEQAKQITRDFKTTLTRLYGSDWKRGAAMVKEWAGRVRRANAKGKQ